MKRTFMLLTGLVLLTAAATSWGQEGRLTESDRSMIRSQLRGLRLTADRQARTCDKEGEGDTADLMRSVSSATLGLNLQIGGTIKTWEVYRQRLASDIMTLKQDVDGAADVNTCKPLQVSNAINEVSSSTAFSIQPPPGNRHRP